MTSKMSFIDGTPLTSNLNVGYSNEEIVVDERAAFSPTDLVQQKLQGLMPTASIPVSCLHTGRQVRRFNT
jgi:hypothetical protein